MLLVAVGLWVSARAHAQEAAGLRLEELQISLWPEYDDPRLLVIYSGRLAAPPDRELRFPIRAGAQVNAVAHLADDGRLLTVSWQSQAAGDQQVITFTPGTAQFQFEYYVDVIGPGPEKTFSLGMSVGEQPVSTLGISVQRPAGASRLQGEPALSGPVEGFEGLSYFSRQMRDVPAGEVVEQTVTYTKPDDALSADQIARAAPDTAETPSIAAPSGPTFSTNVAGRSTTRFWVPLGATAVIVVGLALIGLGAWRGRRGGSAAPPPSAMPRRGARARPRRATPAGAGPAEFCHRCGASFDPADQFCPACGAPRRAQ